MKPKRHYNKQPNIITKSTDDMTLIEKRIMYLVINQLDTGFNIKPDLFKNMEFQIAFNQLHETNYNRIKSAVAKLQFRASTLIDDDDKKEFLRIIPFPSVSIKGGVIRLKMMADVVPYFLEIRKGFTKYELAAALALTSVYAQKLYELLSRWKDKKEWFVSLVELQALLNATNYTYKDFRVRCLETGLNELNDKTDLTATYEVEKTGKSVSDIRFFINTKATEAKETVEYELNQIREMHPAEVAMYANNIIHNYTFSETQRKSLLSDPALFEKFVELDSKLANGVLTAKNPTAYIASILFVRK